MYGNSGITHTHTHTHTHTQKAPTTTIYLSSILTTKISSSPPFGINKKMTCSKREIMMDIIVSLELEVVEVE